MADLSASRLVFFGTAATVLPVFMVAISLQFRVKRIFGRGIGLRLSRPGERAIAAVIAYAMVVLMAVGEITAVGALYYDSNAGHKSAYVFAALAVGTLLVFLGTVDGVVTQMRDSEDTDDRASTEASPPVVLPPAPIDSPDRDAPQ